MPTKLLKWQEAEIRRIENLGHTALVDELILLTRLADGLDKRQEWSANQVEKELRYRLQIFHREDSEPTAYGSFFVRWEP